MAPKSCKRIVYTDKVSITRYFLAVHFILLKKIDCCRVNYEALVSFFIENYKSLLYFYYYVFMRHNLNGQMFEYPEHWVSHFETEYLQCWRLKTDSTQRSSNECKHYSLKIYSEHGNVWSTMKNN